MTTPNHEGRRRSGVPSLREPRYSQSLERGLAILCCFTPERPIRGIADLADELGMSRSTTHRYVVTLVELGYLEQDTQRKYRLGLRVTDLGMNALGSMSLGDHASPHLKRLAEEVGLTAELTVLDGQEVIGVARVLGGRPGQRLSIGLKPDSRLSVHCTASGKLLLAHQPNSEQRRVISGMELTKCGPNTITTKKGLREELGRVREAVLAGDDEESAPDIVAVAAPIHGDDGEMVAAISLVATSAQFSADGLTEVVPYLSSTADRISQHLGHRRPHQRQAVLA